jgi:predicted nucleotidyltransferase
MYPHHAQTIERVAEHFRADPEVFAILLVGSIAHGFAEERSDVDIALVVSDEERQRRAASGRLTLYAPELATYERGYVDAKYLSRGFLDAVEQRGSEPARYAFAHARVIESRIPGLADQLARIARYPVADKAARLARFHGQLQAWNWYAGQAELRQDAYLMNLAAAKLSLFGGRLVLAHNEILYPFHKWFVRVLAQAPDQPAGLISAMQRLNREPSAEHASAFFDLVNGFRAWPTADLGWGEHFLRDTELGWLHGSAAIEDL